MDSLVPLVQLEFPVHLGPLVSVAIKEIAAPRDRLVPQGILEALVPPALLVRMEVQVPLASRGHLALRGTRDPQEGMVKMDPKVQLEALDLRDREVSLVNKGSPDCQVQKEALVLTLSREAQECLALWEYVVSLEPQGPWDSRAIVVQLVLMEVLGQTAMMASQECRAAMVSQGYPDPLETEDCLVLPDNQAQRVQWEPLETQECRETLEPRDKEAQLEIRVPRVSLVMWAI